MRMRKVGLLIVSLVNGVMGTGMHFLALVSIATLMAIPTQGSAIPITFFGEDLNGVETQRLSSTPNSDAARDQFLSQLINPNTADLESFSMAAGAIVEFPPPFLIPFGNETGTATGYSPGNPNQFYLRNITTGTDGGGGYPTSGNQYLVHYIDESVELEFSSPQIAFGLYVGDAGDAGGQFGITLHMVGGATETLTAPHTQGTLTSGAKFYFGVISNDPFDRISLTNQPSGDGFGYDDLTIASSVIPEPSTALLVAAGLLGFKAHTNRRRGSSSRCGDERGLV